MFGKNPIRGLEKGTGEILKIQNIFLTIQGEGPYAGHPSIFVRLGGCNLTCSFCDTEFEEFQEIAIEGILAKISELTKNNHIRLIVITGGEPLRQPINLLCTNLLKNGYHIQIESNGTLYQELPPQVEVVCSPKISNGKYHKIRPDLEEKIVAYKFIISSRIKEYSIIPDWNFNRKKVYIQPMDEYDVEQNLLNQKLAMELTIKTGYIFCLQIHKIIGVE